MCINMIYFQATVSSSLLQLFSVTQVPQVDPIANIGSSLASMNLAGAPAGMGPPSSSAFNLPGALGPLVSAPGSPSRLMGPAAPGPSQSPFPLISLGSQLQHSGAVGSQVGPGPAATSLVPGVGVSAIGALGGRIGPQAAVEKTRLGMCHATVDYGKGKTIPVTGHEGP
jgi:CCR4-NOT transcription complex subunit 1